MGQARRRAGRVRYYHGGHPGLWPGDEVLPQGPGRLARHHEGCAVCDAQAAGQATSIDPATARPDRVYVTTDWLYGKFYASRYGAGDLYVVAPADDLEPSGEDLLPAATCSSAVVVDVLARAVTLTHAERRHLWNRWPTIPGERQMTYRQMVDAVERGAYP